MDKYPPLTIKEDLKPEFEALQKIEYFFENALKDYSLDTLLCATIFMHSELIAQICADKPNEFEKYINDSSKLICTTSEIMLDHIRRGSHESEA